MRRAADWLRGTGREVTVTREPGGTPGAECIRHVLLSGGAQALGVDMEALLFAAARRDNVEQIIRPALRADHVVLCDRFLDSSRVYQSAVGGADAEYMRGLEGAAVEGARPDLTLIFDMPAETSLARLRARQSTGEDDRYEREALDAHRARRDAFLAIAEREPERCRVIDADRPEDDVFIAVTQTLRNALEAA